MRIWGTGHPIADAVAQAFSKADYAGDADLVYGILRHNKFESSTNWFEVDRGYFNPGHFDGYYRISYKGTQAKWHEDIPKQDIEFKLEDWKRNEGYVLVCPPSDVVCEFFDIPTFSEHGLTGYKWMSRNLSNFYFRVRSKGDLEPIDWPSIKGVITFNSSIGWQALQRGIPVYSDPDHSIIGSYYKAKLQNPIDFLSDEYRAIDRKPLYQAMRAHQFTLKEISEGKAWPILQHYLSI